MTILDKKEKYQNIVLHVANPTPITEKMFNVALWYSCWNCIRHAMSKTEKYAKHYFVMSFFSDVCPDAIDDIAG